MNLSHAYGAPLRRGGARVLRAARELGVGMLDTATLYGGGRNEELVAERCAPCRLARRDRAREQGRNGARERREGDRRAARNAARAQVDASLTRLGVDRIDLYYLHRWDKTVPIAESGGARGARRRGQDRRDRSVEVSVARLREALEAFVAAVQNEYSLWSRNRTRHARRDGGARSRSSRSPVARGLPRRRCGARPGILVDGDIRRGMPRFQPGHWPANAALLPEWKALAAEAGLTPAQLALAWVLTREHVCRSRARRASPTWREDIAASRSR
jgi:aryl-alcohol dehydrogenase-like predicted oxidoreductase